MTAPADTPPESPAVDPRLHALRTLAGFLVRHGRDRPSPPEPPATEAVAIAPRPASEPAAPARRAA
jgi:hypothetical protein